MAMKKTQCIKGLIICFLLNVLSSCSLLLDYGDAPAPESCIPETDQEHCDQPCIAKPWTDRCGQQRPACKCDECNWRESTAPSEWTYWFPIVDSPASSSYSFFTLDPTNQTDPIEVVADSRTCLVWQGNLPDPQTRMSFEDAEKYCAELGAGWRLPTATELLSIVDYNKSNPAIEDTAFPKTESDYYWTSTVSVIDIEAQHKWQVNFEKGYSRHERPEKDEYPGKGYVRCVH